MSAFRLAAGSIGLAIGAAVVTALAASPEVKPPAPPPMTEATATEAKAPPAAAKSDRLAIRRAKSPVTSAWACPQEPWPYGCQWRSPTRKVLRPSRPS